MRKHYLLAALAMMMLAPALARAADPFAGQWKVTVTPDEDARKAGEKEFADTLTFKGNKFMSEACKPHGFGEADYEEDVRRVAVATFKATPTSPTDGKAQWSGTVTGTDISGEMVWTKKDGTELRYTFKGSKS